MCNPFTYIWIIFLFPGLIFFFKQKVPFMSSLLPFCF
uniref:Uncharacterized protein n=1 Tax=Arundo donax TaxID=35708 RepID=A0A0A9BN95_ARUDO